MRRWSANRLAWLIYVLALLLQKLDEPNTKVEVKRSNINSSWYY